MSYSHLTYENRQRIEYLHRLGCSQADIARQLGVHRSTISNELKRNSVRGKYEAYFAQYTSEVRKKRSKGYLLRRKGGRYYMGYAAPYQTVGWFDRQIRLWKEKGRRRFGRNYLEWRVLRKDASQFNRWRFQSHTFRKIYFRVRKRGYLLKKTDRSLRFIRHRLSYGRTSSFYLKVRKLFRLSRSISKQLTSRSDYSASSDDRSANPPRAFSCASGSPPTERLKAHFASCQTNLAELEQVLAQCGIAMPIPQQKPYFEKIPP